MPLHDAGYKHWEGEHLGIWARRGVIAMNGLRLCLDNKWMRHLVMASWLSALAMVAILFSVGQLLVADSIIVLWVGNLNKELQTIAKGLTTWLELHPEVSVRTTQNLLFYYYAVFMAPVAIFGLALVVPNLITRDLSSNAIIIYSSKAVSRFDYFLGKFAVAFGLLSVIWLGPVMTAWFVGNLLAPNWGFFWHSRGALFHCLEYMLVAMTVLSVLAMGVSSLSANEKGTSAAWMLWWLLSPMLVGISRDTKPWLKFLSFSYDLDQVALYVFSLHKDLDRARDNIPLFGEVLRNVKRETMDYLANPAIDGALLALALMVGGFALFIHRRVRPQ